MAIVLALVQARINMHKGNNTKSTVQTIQNTVNASTHITKTPTPTHTHTHTLQNKLKQQQRQVKTNTVQGVHKWNSHNITKYSHYRGTAVAQWLRCCGTNRKVAGSIPAGDNLPPSCAVVKKSGSLNFLECSGPVQDSNGTALTFIFTLI